MDTRLQLRVQRYGWDKAAAHYNRYWADQLEPAQTRLIELAELSSGEHVLDVACGTGLVTFRAAEAVGANGRVLATDISDEMVQRVYDMAAIRGLGQVKTERVSVDELRVENGSFDVALCALGLMYVPDPRAAIGVMMRALRPNGRLVVAVWGAREQCGWADIFSIVDRRVASEVCPLFFHLGTGNALEYLMARAGCRDVNVERIGAILRYATAADACSAAFASGPVALVHAQFDERTRDEVYAEYLQSIEPFRSDAGYAIPGEFVVARGRSTSGAG
jgi:ubiquinone/menaquinone biosynthesis C-methylase UbiE